MKHRKPLFKHNEMDKSNKNGLFAIIPAIPQIIIIAIVFGAYYYVKTKGYFPLWITYIYYAAKVIIAFEIIIAGAKSLTVPLLTIVLGVLNLYWLQVDGFEIISANDSWQLIIVGAIGFILTFIIRSSKK